MENTKVKNTGKWIALLIASFLMVGFALSLQALPPLFDLIKKNIYLTNSQAGLLMGAYAIPGIFLPFIIAMLSKRINMQKLLATALVIMIVGLIAFSISNTFLTLMIFRLVMGVGSTMIVVLSPLLITTNFEQKNMGIAMGFFNIAVPVGTTLAANLFGLMGAKLGWRWVILIISLYLTILLFFVLFGLSFPKVEVKSEKRSSTRGRVNIGLWALAVIWALANAQMLAYITFGSKFYQMFDISPQRSSFLTSLIMFVPIFLTPLIGIAFDKTRVMKPYLFIGYAISLLSFILLSINVFNLSLLAFMVGVGFSPVTVFVFSYLPETVKPSEMGIGLGMLTVASNLGTTLGPVVLGSVLDITGGKYTIAFIILAAISFINIAVSLLLKKK